MQRIWPTSTSFLYHYSSPPPTPIETRNQLKTGQAAQPVPPIFQPEVAARAIYWGALHPRRQIWVGFPTIKTILANRIFPGLLDRLLARTGYTSQLAAAKVPKTPGNLFKPVEGAYGSHGRFDRQARPSTYVVVTSRQWNLGVAMATLCVAATACRWLMRPKN
jgi:hypothetical protein